MLGFDMLIGRFLMMIPVLALAGNLAQKKSVPPSPGTFPVNTALFHGAADRRGSDARRAHLLPGAEPGTDSGTPAAARRASFSNRSHRIRTRRNGLSWLKKRVFGIRKSWPRHCWIRCRKLDPRWMVKNPVMFVVEVGSVLTTALLIDNTVHHRVRLWLQPADHALAVVHGAVRQLCRGHGRGPRQGPGRHAAQGQGRDDCQALHRRRRL